MFWISSKKKLANDSTLTSMTAEPAQTNETTSTASEKQLQQLLELGRNKNEKILKVAL